MVDGKCSWAGPDNWNESTQRLFARLHGRNRWSLTVLMMGILFAHGRRTVTAWLRAAGASDDYQGYYYFLAALGRKIKSVATQLLILLVERLPLPERVLLIIDDSPTKRYGRNVEGAGIHRHPTPGPAVPKFLYGHLWVTLSLAARHPTWGSIGLPLLSMLYVRRQTIPAIPKKRGWRFATKLQLAARLCQWAVPLLQKSGKKVWIAMDGGYTKRPFLQPALSRGATIVGRLRHDAALRRLPPEARPAQRRPGGPRTYGAHKISLAKRAGHGRGWQAVECQVYRQTTAKLYKTFLASYAPVGA